MRSLGGTLLHLTGEIWKHGQTHMEGREREETQGEPHVEAEE